MKHRKNVWSEGFAVYLLHCGYSMSELDAMSDEEISTIYCEHIQKYGEDPKAKKAEREYCISFM